MKPRWKHLLIGLLIFLLDASAYSQGQACAPAKGPLASNESWLYFRLRSWVDEPLDPRVVYNAESYFRPKDVSFRDEALGSFVPKIQRLLQWEWTGRDLADTCWALKVSKGDPANSTLILRVRAVLQSEGPFTINHWSDYQDPTHPFEIRLTPRTGAEPYLNKNGEPYVFAAEGVSHGHPFPIDEHFVTGLVNELSYAAKFIGYDYAVTKLAALTNLRRSYLVHRVANQLLPYSPLDCRNCYTIENIDHFLMKKDIQGWLETEASAGAIGREILRDQASHQFPEFSLERIIGLDKTQDTEISDSEGSEMDSALILKGKYGLDIKRALAALDSLKARIRELDMTEIQR